MPSISSSEIQHCCFSNHDYVVLSVQLAGDHTRGPGLWKFNNSLLSMICYNARNIFHRSSPGGIFSKVPSRWEIVAFASDKRKRLSQDKVLLTNRIIDLKLSLASGNVSGNVELESRFQSLIVSELGGYKTRSRVQWLEEGERLTRFFFRYSS